MTNPLLNIIEHNMSRLDDDDPVCGKASVRATNRANPKSIAGHKLAAAMLQKNPGLSKQKACNAAARQVGIKASTLYTSWNKHAGQINCEESNHGK